MFWIVVAGGLGLYWLYQREHQNSSTQKFGAVTAGNQTPRLIIAKASWCGHCQHAAPVFKELAKIKSLNGKRFETRIIDADKDKAELAKYQVSGFPTLILVLPDGRQEVYQGERSLDAIISWATKLI